MTNVVENDQISLEQDVLTDNISPDDVTLEAISENTSTSAPPLNPLIIPLALNDNEQPWSLETIETSIVDEVRDSEVVSPEREGKRSDFKRLTLYFVNLRCY